MKSTVILAVIAISLVTGVVGCSRQPDPTSSAAAQPEPDATTPTNSAPAAPAAPSDAVIASADSELPGLRVEVQELKRTEGNTLTLKLAFVNTGGETHFTVGNLAQVNLIDAVGKKKYFVVRDSQDACLCSRNVSPDAGARANMWAKFPAPPEDVQKISVMVPQFQPLEGIPISQ